MATATASPPGASPPPSAAMAKSPSLTPLITTTQTRRIAPNQRPMSMLAQRISSYSSNRSVPPVSRPESTVFPAYSSSLPYTLVRDFAYPWTHPTHYGRQIEESAPTPASDSRRLSDPALATWEDSRGQWSATPHWMPDTASHWSTRDQLPARTFNDGGPPYSEDEDLQSPVVKTSRHRKNKSERGRSPGAAGPYRGVIIGAHGNQIEEYRPTASDADELDGPGGEIETYTTGSNAYTQPQHRDSNFAAPIRRGDNRGDQSVHDSSYGRSSEEYGSDEEGEIRYSKDYSFSIASPDEEMHGKAVALFDFESEHENELPLREGQIILVSYRHGQGWLVAEDPVSGESGLVPEEFVRLARHIEGGLNGLSNLDDGAESEVDVLTPATNDPGSATTPTIPFDAFDRDKDRDKERDRQTPAVQSNFSTHTRDFSPRPRTGTGSKDDNFKPPAA